MIEAAVPPARGRVGATLERRLAALRAARLAASGGIDSHGTSGAPPPAVPADPVIAGSSARLRATALADRLARAVGGERVATRLGTYVRVDAPSARLPVDRAALAAVPTLPDPAATFVCLDTETTGLATAAGTFVFLVGIGRWIGDRFEQVQLLLPEQSEEKAFLSALRDLLPAGTHLVTYNGRSFDWPLLVARYRMGRDAPPPLAGHLDLLPYVRRTFRHRLPDARLRTVERELLGLRRTGDVDGWEIPGRYLGFLRGSNAAILADVVRHNHEDVRSLGRLIAHVAEYLGCEERWSDGHPGDLAAHARALRRAGRDEAALMCLDAAIEAAAGLARLSGTERAAAPAATAIPPAATLLADRARTLARLRRYQEAADTWLSVATIEGPTPAAPGSLAGPAWIEVAKLREHRQRDPVGALLAADAARQIAERSRALGRPLRALEEDVPRRSARLRRRLARAGRHAGDD